MGGFDRSFVRTRPPACPAPRGVLLLLLLESWPRALVQPLLLQYNIRVNTSVLVHVSARLPTSEKTASRVTVVFPPDLRDRVADRHVVPHGRRVAQFAHLSLAHAQGRAVRAPLSRIRAHRSQFDWIHLFLGQRSTWPNANRTYARGRVRRVGLARAHGNRTQQASAASR